MTSYFPRELNILIINYLNSEEESLRLLNLLEIKEKYYTSKLYFWLSEEMTCIKYKIERVTVGCDGKEIDKIKDMKIKRIKFCLDDFYSYINYPTIIVPHGSLSTIYPDSYDCDARILSFVPKEVTHLEFISNFNCRINNIPKQITHLSLGRDFNQPVDNLPEGLTHLTFGRKFDKPADNLPKTLTHLTFGTYFDQKVDNLPNTLKIGGCETSSYLV